MRKNIDERCNVSIVLILIVFDLVPGPFLLSTPKKHSNTITLLTCDPEGSIFVLVGKPFLCGTQILSGIGLILQEVSLSCVLMNITLQRCVLLDSLHIITGFADRT